MPASSDMVGMFRTRLQAALIAHPGGGGGDGGGGESLQIARKEVIIHNNAGRSVTPVSGTRKYRVTFCRSI